jgi:hypothetical protein
LKRASCSGVGPVGAAGAGRDTPSMEPGEGTGVGSPSEPAPKEGPAKLLSSPVDANCRGAAGVAGAGAPAGAGTSARAARGPGKCLSGSRSAACIAATDIGGSLGNALSGSRPAACIAGTDIGAAAGAGAGAGMDSSSSIEVGPEATGGTIAGVGAGAAIDGTPAGVRGCPEDAARGPRCLMGSSPAVCIPATPVGAGAGKCRAGSILPARITGAAMAA